MALSIAWNSPEIREIKVPEASGADLGRTVGGAFKIYKNVRAAQAVRAEEKNVRDELDRLQAEESAAQAEISRLKEERDAKAAQLGATRGSIVPERTEEDSGATA